QRSEVRGQRSEVRGQRSEVRGQRSEVRGQRSEVKNQASEKHHLTRRREGAKKKPPFQRGCPPKAGGGLSPLSPRGRGVWGEGAMDSASCDFAQDGALRSAQNDGF
ncbi:MAG: hypothetical protein FWC38_05795, partial [Proteobacteria bacterium]|nr:hypothetical protein [Pseudomonadota bacterium]